MWFDCVLTVGNKKKHKNSGQSIGHSQITEDLVMLNKHETNVVDIKDKKAKWNALLTIE